jgi:cytochrome c-type biogenesis protein CcmH
MLGFWIVAGAMTAAAVAFVAARLVFPRRVPVHAEPREANLAALRASWAELERDCATGVLPAAERDSARAELARRAEVELDEAPRVAPMRPAWPAALAAAVLIPLAAFVVYPRIGSPGAIESAGAFGSLEGALTAERLPAFRNQLARHVAGNPADGRAWALLARIDLSLEHFGDAAIAFERALRASPKVAGDAEVWVDYAEAVGMAEGRTLRGRPEALIAKALALDPSNPRALEMAGSLAMENGDPAQAARHWQLALERLDPADPRRADLARAVARVGSLAGTGGMTKR